MNKWKSLYKQPISVRVFNFLKCWVTYHYNDFATDNSLKTKLLSALEVQVFGSIARRVSLFFQTEFTESMADNHIATLRSLLERQEAVAEDRRRGLLPLPLDTSPPPPIPCGDFDPSSVTLLDLSTLEVARQLALLAWDAVNQMPFWSLLPNFDMLTNPSSIIMGPLRLVRPRCLSHLTPNESSGNAASLHG